MPESGPQSMLHANLSQELDELLSKSVASAKERAKTIFDQISNGSKELVLYGAGTLGRRFLAGLRELGIKPLAFADETPSKLGQLIDGLQVFHPHEAAQKFGDAAVFVVTICNSSHRYLQTKQHLAALNCSKVASYLSLAYKYPEVFLPYYQFDAPHKMLNHASSIRSAFALLSDEESRRQFLAHLKFRFSLDFNVIPENSPDKYFPNSIVPPLDPKTVFVDCGAYDGDTLRIFLKRQDAHFRKVLAFEPDPSNFRKLEQYVSTLDQEQRGKIRPFNYALGAQNSRVLFDAVGNEGSSVNSSGAVEVDVVSLDEILANEQPTFIKFDIEGAEQDALRGIQNIVRLHHPILAVCVYHLPDDLWQIPLSLHSLGKNYNLFLRTEGEDGLGTVCYAVPKSA